MWSMDAETNVGTFCVRANENADEEKILEEIKLLAKPVFKHLTVQVEKDPPTTWFLKASENQNLSSPLSSTNQYVSGISRTPQRAKGTS